jgi:hypothetical protein
LFIVHLKKKKKKKIEKKMEEDALKQDLKQDSKQPDLKSISSFPFRLLGFLNLENEEAYENLIEAIENLPEDHPLKQVFSIIEGKKKSETMVTFLDKETNITWTLLPRKPKILQAMDLLFANPDTAFMGKRALMYYFKQQRIYVKTKWIEEYLGDNILHKMKKTKKKNTIVRPVLASGPNVHWQLDLIDLNKMEDLDPNTLRLNRFMTIGENPYKATAKYILVCVDVFSKYVYLRPVQSKSVFDVYPVLEEILNTNKTRFGVVPQILQHDRGTEFGEYMTQKLKEKFPQIQSISSLAHKPSSQGIVERTNQTVKDYLRQLFAITGQRDFVEHLSNIEYRINNTYHSSIECSPTEIHTHLPQNISLPQSYQQFVQDFLKNNKAENERTLHPKYYGDDKHLDETQKQTLKKIAQANWLLLKKAHKRITKIKQQNSALQPFLNRDFVKNPLYVLISADALYQRNLHKQYNVDSEQTAKTLLKPRFTTIPLQVSRVFQDQQGNIRIVTFEHPNKAFYIHEVHPVSSNALKNFESLKKNWKKIHV